MVDGWRGVTPRKCEFEVGRDGRTRRDAGRGIQCSARGTRVRNALVRQGGNAASVARRLVWPCEEGEIPDAGPEEEEAASTSARGHACGEEVHNQDKARAASMLAVS